MKIKSIVCAIAAGLSFAASAAETLPVPKEWVHGFINGYFTLIAYSFNGDTAMPVEVQVKEKGAADSAYWTFYKGIGTNGQYTYDGSCDPFKTDLNTGRAVSWNMSSRPTSLAR